MLLNNFLLSSTPTQREKASEIAILKKISPTAEDDYLLQGCYMLKRVAQIKTIQYAFICNISAFLEYSETQFHSKDNTNMLDDLLEGKKIYIASYRKKNEQND